MSMLVIHVMADGPVAAAYTYRVALRAQASLQHLYPNEKVWIAPASTPRVTELNLDVLSAPEDAELVTAYRHTAAGTHKHRITLRGLIRHGPAGDTQPEDLVVESHDPGHARDLAALVRAGGYHPVHPDQLTTPPN